MIVSLLLSLFLLYFSGFCLSIIYERNDYVDIVWGIAGALIAWIAWSFGDFSIAVPLLVSVWGLRLSLRISSRQKKKGEDVRYRKWRDEWMVKGCAYFYVRSLFQVYVLQAILVSAVLGSVISLAYISDFGFSFLVKLSVFLWLTGFIFEVVSDYQLDKFMKKPRGVGEVCSSGLWGYSRHPNYFGEVVMWFGVWLLCVGLGGSALTGISTPVTISILILFVSGIPMTEELFKNNSNYDLYKEKVSVFFPLPPKE